MFQLDSDIHNKARQMRLSEMIAGQNADLSNIKMDAARNEMRQSKALEYLGMATPENWGAVRQKAISEGLGDESVIPEQFDQSWIDRSRAALLGSSQQAAPASIQEFNLYERLRSQDPAAADRFMNVKRASQIVDLGGQKIVRDQMGNTVDQYQMTPKPQDMPAFKAEQEAAKLNAETKVKNAAALPDKLAAAEMSIGLIDQMIGNEAKGMKEHSGLESAIGPISSRLPSLSGDAADFEALLDQAKGGAFLQSIQQMQGFGALSNQEGQAAVAAATRMRSAMSEDGFREAAREYRGIINKGMERMRQKAGASDGGLPAVNLPSMTGGNEPAPKTIKSGMKVDWNSW